GLGVQRGGARASDDGRRGEQFRGIAEASDRALPERGMGIYAVRLPAGEAGRGSVAACGGRAEGGGGHLPAVSDAGRDGVPQPPGARAGAVRRAGHIRTGGRTGGFRAAAGVGTGRRAARGPPYTLLLGGSGAAGAGGGARGAPGVGRGRLEGLLGGGARTEVRRGPEGGPRARVR